MSKRRRKHGQEVAQKGKNRSRPRSWRRGAAAGRRAVPVLDQLAAATVRAEEDRAAVAATAASHQRDVRDYQSLLDGLDRVSPCVLSPLPDRLL